MLEKHLHSCQVTVELQHCVCVDVAVEDKPVSFAQQNHTLVKVVQL